MVAMYWHVNYVCGCVAWLCCRWWMKLFKHRIGSQALYVLLLKMFLQVVEFFVVVVVVFISILIIFIVVVIVRDLFVLLPDFLFNIWNSFLCVCMCVCAYMSTYTVYFFPYVWFLCLFSSFGNSIWLLSGLFSIFRNAWWCFPFEAMEALSCHLMWVAAATYCSILAPKSLLATLIGVLGMAHFSLGKCNN